MSLTPGSGNGRVRPRQYSVILVRIAVTARNAVCFVSSSFLPALRNGPCASKGSAAWAFCSAVSDFLVPNQVNWTRQAAIVVRSCSAGVLLSVLVRPLVDRDSRRSIKVLIEPPEKRKADHRSAVENGFCLWSRELESTVRRSQEGYQRLAVLSSQHPKHWLDLVQAVMAQSSCAGLGCWRDHELAGLVLVFAG